MPAAPGGASAPRRPSDTERAAAATADPTAVSALRAILRIRPFRRLWIVLGVASLGDWLGLLATAGFAAAQFDKPSAQGAAFGGTIVVRLLPALLLGPVAGVLADRFDRRYTMIVCDLLRFALFASIPVSALFTDNRAAIISWTVIATFLIESITMAWLPAKDAAVPNLLPRGRLETANQLTLATTYGITPVAAALLLAGLERGLAGVHEATGVRLLDPLTFSLYFLALSRLATAWVVYAGIKEIGGRNGRGHVQPSVLREFINGWAYVGKTPLVRGLVFGILAAFAGGGMVVGAGKFYAASLGGGDPTFYVLFAMIFVGLALGISVGPAMIGALSRRRWFGLSIVLAGVSVGLMAFAWHLSVAVIFALLVGVAAGMAFLSGTTLLGGEVEDEVRGRVFAFVNMATRIVLMLAIGLSSLIVGLGSERLLQVGSISVSVSTTRLLLLVAGAVGVLAGIGAFRQMDDKPGVPVLADLWGSLRGRPLAVPEAATRTGLFIVFEGGEGAGKSTQADLLAANLIADGHDVVVTREPGATEVGRRIRNLLLDRSVATGPAGIALAPRAEALLYAADRAHHVATVVRPALAKGAIVISDRYIDSSLAYQGAGRVLPPDEIAWLSAWATGGLRPDLIVVLDIDPEAGLARVAASDTHRLRSESTEFHERVRYAFLDLAGRDPRRYFVVDATLPPAKIAEIVAERARSLLPESANRPPPNELPVDDIEVPAPPAVADLDTNHGGAGNGLHRRSSDLSNVDGKR